MILPFLFACKEKPKNPVAEYGNAMMDAYQRGQQVGEKESLNAIRTAVQSYYASHGSYPQSLNDLKEFIGSEIDASKYDYNPQSGAVNLKGN